MKFCYWQKVEIVLYLAFFVFLYMGQYSEWTGAYRDSDNYFHALRVMLLMKNPTFGEQIFPYTNYPFGEVLHWTRALGIFLILFTLPFLKIFPLKTAVFYGGLLVAPFFGLSGGYFLILGCRLFLRWKYRLLTAGLLLVQANVMRVIAFDRPDHHAAFFCLAALMLWVMAKFIDTKKTGYLLGAAVIAAFALWMAAEGIFLAVAAGGFLLYGYLFLGENYQNILRFVFIYSLAITLFLAINPPYEGLGHIDTGRLSAFYVCAAWGLTAILFAACQITHKHWRILAAVAGFMAMMGIMFVAGWLTSPLDKRIIPLFVNRISEMSAGNMYTLAYPFFGCVAGLMLFNKLKRNGIYLYLMISLGLFSGLTVFSIHFLMYAGLFAAIMLALFVQTYLCATSAKVLLCIWLILLEFVSFTVYALLTEMKLPPVLIIPMEVVQALPSGTVATDVFFAPDFIWDGGHNVIASPYHRNVEGILDNHMIFFETDENEVIRLLRKHQVTYLFLAEGIDDTYYFEPQNNCDKLYGKILSCGDVPHWLERIPTPSGFLYKVNLK